MRARAKFTTESVKETLVGILKEHHWWPHYAQDSEEAKCLIAEVRDSVEEGDADLFDGSDKVVLSHTPTDSRGTLSLEHNVWVLRVLNPSIHLLQLACEIFVAQLVERATRNHRKIAFVGPIQIVERRRKETIIEGRALATPEDRISYARSHRGIEFRIAQGGAITLGILLLITYPWPWWTAESATLTWVLSICEKFIGSVAVATLISYFQYRSFRGALRDHTIRWAIPGEPERLDVKPHSV